MTGVIVCLGLNPALDITYRIDRLVHGESQRVPRVVERAGGKATNVARVVRDIGGQSRLIAPLSGQNGDLFTAHAAQDGLIVSALPTSRPTRRTVTVVEDDGTTTGLNEAGVEQTAADWASVRDRSVELIRTSRASVLVLSGSLPPGCPDDAYAELVAAATHSGVLTIVDCDGPALIAALAAGATMVKPNRHELLATTGAEGSEGIARLRRQAPQSIVVASDGPRGVLCIGPDGGWRGRPAQELTGNPTGAGDALVGALALGLARGDSMPELLRAGIGSSAAAVLEPVAGVVDPERAWELAHSAVIESLTGEYRAPSVILD